MQNDPSLNPDQQNQADQMIKAGGLKKTNEFIKPGEGLDDHELSEEEKAKLTKPEDFEKFNLDDA